MGDDASDEAIQSYIETWSIGRRVRTNVERAQYSHFEMYLLRLIEL